MKVQLALLLGLGGQGDRHDDNDYALRCLVCGRERRVFHRRADREPRHAIIRKSDLHSGRSEEYRQQPWALWHALRTVEETGRG